MENFNINNYKHIHMIGIGGISMSGIAEILVKSGFIVTGSDANKSEITDKLTEHGIPVVIGHDFVNLRKANLVVQKYNPDPCIRSVYLWLSRKKIAFFFRNRSG